MRIINRLLALCCAVIAANCLLAPTCTAQDQPDLNLSPPPLPVVLACELNRSPAGIYTLHLIGHNFSQEAMVTINEVAPKKLKFKGDVAGEQGLVRLVAKGRLCESLPGNVVVRNPNGLSGPAFNCNQRCRG